MKLISFLLVSALILIGGPARAMSEWDRLNNELESLYQQGEYSRAVPIAKRALEAAERTLDDENPALATSLNSLALLHNAQGQYAQAEPLLKRALTIFEKSMGAESQEVAATLNNLGMIYKNRGDYPGGRAAL